MSERDRVHRLWRRVGLGAGAETLRKWSDSRSLVDHLMAYAQESDPLPGPPPFPSIPPGITPTLLLLGESISWWLQRMVATTRPMEEWLTLFWHRHFATSASRVFSPGMMLGQNQTLRRLGGGRFGELLKGLLWDPATAVWLDLSEGRSDAPRETFAHDLLELYTVGPGHYTGADQQALARLFTGYSLAIPSFQVRFDPARHDGRPSRALGWSGQPSAEEALERLAVHPATARRLTDRLWRALTGQDPPPQAPWSDLWIRTRGHVSAVLRCMLLSEDFYRAPSRVQSPLELYIAARRLLEDPKVPLQHVQRLHQLGECPMLPPTVHGWGEGLEWVHPSGMLDRFNLMWDLAARLPADHPLLRELQALPSAQQPAAVLRMAEGWSFAEATRQALQGLLGQPRALLATLLCSPDFQMV